MPAAPSALSESKNLVNAILALLEIIAPAVDKRVEPVLRCFSLWLKPKTFCLLPIAIGQLDIAQRGYPLHSGTPNGLWFRAQTDVADSTIDL